MTMIMMHAQSCDSADGQGPAPRAAPPRKTSGDQCRGQLKPGDQPAIREDQERRPAPLARLRPSLAGLRWSFAQAPLVFRAGLLAWSFWRTLRGYWSFRVKRPGPLRRVLHCCDRITNSCYSCLGYCSCHRGEIVSRFWLQLRCDCGYIR